MKTLLIPTDFDVQSLYCIPHLVQQHPGQKLNLVLVHMMKITDNMQELLMLSRRSTEHQHISAQFYQTCTALKKQYSSINEIRIEFFYGSTVAVFKNFLEAQQVDAIAVPENYSYQMLNKNSIDPALLVNRSGLTLITTSCEHVTQPVAMPAVTTETLIEENA